MRFRKMWQRWGAWTALVCTLLFAILTVLSRFWTIEYTTWAEYLGVLNRPPNVLSRVIFRLLGVPRLYDVPLTLSETLVIFSITWPSALPGGSSWAPRPRCFGRGFGGRW